MFGLPSFQHADHKRGSETASSAPSTLVAPHSAAQIARQSRQRAGSRLPSTIVDKSQPSVRPRARPAKANVHQRCLSVLLDVHVDARVGAQQKVDHVYVWCRTMQRSDTIGCDSCRQDVANHVNATNTDGGQQRSFAASGRRRLRVQVCPPTWSTWSRERRHAPAPS
jgi:hypothetical protein